MATDTSMVRVASSPEALARQTNAAVTASPANPATASAAVVPRMIVRNATMSVVVRDAVDALRQASAHVEAKGGYVTESRQWKEREQVRASATLRVPAAQLSATIAAIRGLAVRVESENVSAEDVSAEFSDLGARLRNLQAAETELRELLTTIRQRSQKASEVMEVYAEITKVRGEIDQIQGRRQYLSQVTALSTIKLELIPDVLAAPVVEPGWQPSGTVKTAARALVNSLKWIADLLIWITLYVLPLGLVFALLALLLRPLWRRLRSMNERMRSTPTKPSPPGM
jgi:hypothetical protein